MKGPWHRLKSRGKGIWLALPGLLVLLNGCERELAPVGPGPEPLQPTFSSIQDNILTPKCVNLGCHPPAGPMSLQKGVAYGNLVNQPSAYGMPRVDPGNAENSALYLKVIGDPRVGGPSARMPLGGPPLSQEEINVIKQWIDQGAPNN